jgi:serine/threonine-protein kinase
MDRLTLIVFGFLTLIGILSYSEKQDPAVLFFIFVAILMLFTIPRIFDLLKDWRGTKKEDKEKSKDWQILSERMENLEALICRMDSEINQQLERTLSAGKYTTVPDERNSMMPTTFINVAAALEGRFQILKELGRGGMGIVFQAHDKQLKEQVAIKILSPLLGQDPEALERLKREVSAARRITHPNVIRIHDLTETGGLHYVSMEYFPGQNLKEYLHQTGALSLMQAYNIASQICDGVAAAHSQGVIHRDLKSQNVILNAAQRVKIIDFGLARTSQVEGMTVSGLILGTPEYMAPEQVTGKRVDERADVYSLGIILYELFTGRVPFTGDSAIAVSFKQVKEEAMPPSKLNPQVNPELEKVILRALQKDPRLRYASVLELQSELRKAVGASVPEVLARQDRKAVEAEPIRE